MPFANLELVISHDEEWSLHSACIGAELDLSPVEVSDDGDLSLDTTVSPQSLEILEQTMGVACETNPVSIDEDFGHP